MTRRCLPTLALVVAGMFASTPAPAHAATLTGRLQGVLELAAAPSVPWRVELAPGATATSLPLTLSAGTDGLELRVALNQQAGRDTVWHIETATVDLVEWWPTIRSLAGLDETFAGWRLSGRVSVSGEGTLSADGQPVGRVRLTLEEGRAVHDADGIEVRGIRADISCEDLTGFALDDGQTVRIGNLKAAGIEAGDAVVRFGRAADGVVRLQELSAKVFGGTVSLAPFSFDPGNGRLLAKVEFKDISLVQLVMLVPSAISQADGLLTGSGTLDWKVTDPMPNIVRLHVEKSDNAQLSLAAQPGFLSSGVPPRIAFVPPSWGLIHRLFSPANPIYQPLVNIELGRHQLSVDTLELTFNLKPNPGDRSAHLRLETRPVDDEDAKAIKSLTIDLNVHGSLSEVISLGMDKRLR